MTSVHSLTVRLIAVRVKRYADGISSQTRRPELVGPVEIARVLDLLVLAHAVEAHRLGELDVLLQRGVVRRRQQRVGPVALVEHHPQAGTAGR
jgi:hypothetical protein